MYDAYGLIYISADNRTAAPEKKRDSTQYAGEAGEHVDGRAVKDAFDYTIQLLIETPNKDMTNANAKIAAFNAAIREGGRCKRVTFYNDYKRVKIAGIPEIISEPTSFYRRQDGSVMDCVEVELKIRVDDPEECDFSTLAQYERYDKRDLTDGWWGYNETNGTVYMATANYARSLVTPVRKGDRITFTTKGVGAAWPLFIVNESRVALYSISELLEFNDELIESDYDGLLLVNCVDSAWDRFSVTIDRRDTEAGIMALNLSEP